MSKIIQFPSKKVLGADGKEVASLPEADEVRSMSEEDRTAVLVRLDLNRKRGLQECEEALTDLEERESLLDSCDLHDVVTGTEASLRQMERYLKGSFLALEAVSNLVGYLMYDLSTVGGNTEQATVTAETNSFRLSVLSQYLAEQELITVDGFSEVAQRVMKQLTTPPEAKEE